MRKDRVEFSFEPIAVGLILLFAGMSAQAGTNVWTGAAFRNASVSAGETSFTYMKHGMILFVR